MPPKTPKIPLRRRIDTDSKKAHFITLKNGVRGVSKTPRRNTHVIKNGLREEPSPYLVNYPNFIWWKCFQSGERNLIFNWFWDHSRSFPVVANQPRDWEANWNYVAKRIWCRGVRKYVQTLIIVTHSQRSLQPQKVFLIFQERGDQLPYRRWYLYLEHCRRAK